MPTTDDFPTLTNDDLRATRVLNLAIKFFGSASAIPSSVIAHELYPHLDEPSFMRQYLRDRELLATFGLLIKQVPNGGGDTLWKVDESASYVEGAGLTPEDARVLYVLCHDLTLDQSFAHRDELRMALAKIAQVYHGIALSRNDTTSPYGHKLLNLLVGCMNNRHAIKATYTDARGTTSERTLALLGSFGLRDQTYFVASRVERDGTLVDDSIRTYRLDRFDKASELPRCRYEIPLDFAVSDYERLPFQIGDTLGTATFELPTEPGSELRSALAGHGHVADAGEPDGPGEPHGPDGPRTWTVPYSDLQAAASWAIGADIVPTAPAELVDAYRNTLARSAAYEPYDPELSVFTFADATTQPALDKVAVDNVIFSSNYAGKAATRKATAKRPGASRGRIGSITLSRQLITLASSLTREGRVITARDIASNLGVDDAYARRLIALVAMGSGESYDYLPVVLNDDEDEVSLMEGAALDVRRVRLTRSETIALQAALVELGVGQDDPLAKTLIEAYGAPSFSLEDIARTLETPPAHADVGTLRSCSQAISAGNGLVFHYRPVCGGAGSERFVQPQLVSRNDDNWYLHAYDLQRADDRVFRLDHMSALREVPLTDAQRREPQPRTQTDAPLVTLRFADPRYLELFHWNRLEVVAHDERGITCRLPLFGGTWLARHIIACGGTVTTDSQPLAKQIKS